MIKAQKFLTLLLAVLLIASCDGGTTDTSSSSDSSSITSIEEIDEYDDWLNTWSQSGHLYLHYLRPKATAMAEYDNYALWIWQNAPQDLEGSLYCGTEAAVLSNFHKMNADWMDNVGDSGNDVMQSGRIVDIDLAATNVIGGKTGDSTGFIGATRIGFLIVLESSMGGGTHWTSDGGANTYIDDLDSHKRSNGAIHVFCVQGSVGDYKFSYDAEYTENPTVDDETKGYRSGTELSDTSSNDTYTQAVTSSTFKTEMGIGYQIFVASFADSNGDGMGDIRGIINSLDYLQSLKVNCLWLTPIQQSESYHGYDVTDFAAIDSKFGTMADYRELVDEVHLRGMTILMDFVINHTSKNNVWFKKSQRAEEGIHPVTQAKFKYRDMYHWKYAGDLVRKWNETSSVPVADPGYGTATATYTNIPVEQHPDWYRDGESNYYYYGKFGSGMAELNYESQITRDLVIEMAKNWLEFGVDGFRLDAVKHIYMLDEAYRSGDQVVSDTGERTYYDEEKMQTVTVKFDYSSNLSKNIAFWKEFSHKIKQSYPNAFLVGENFDGWDDRMSPYYKAMDSQFDFGLYYHNLEYNYQKAQGKNAVANALEGNATETVHKSHRDDYINGAFTSNHDVLRAINHINVASGSSNLGNNPTIGSGDVATQIKKAQTHAAITLMQPGLSWIYYGDELGMSGNTSQDTATNANNMDRWYRQPFKWGASDDRTTGYRFNMYTVEHDNYNKNTLKSAAEQAVDNNSMLALYKKLAEIKNYADFPVNGDYTGWTYGDSSDVQHFQIAGATATYKVYVNCGSSTLTISPGTVVLAWNATSTSLPPYGIVISKV
ncbi:MAG: alpha-amylase family glycosyl hydrolase [Bacilli bacterium]|jgi:glycosidase